MLLPDNIHPELSIYYNGSIVLTALKQKSCQIVELYSIAKELKEMSFPTFILSLDWLYLIEFIKINEKGYVELCS